MCEQNIQNHTVMIKILHLTYCIQDFKLLLCLKNINLPKQNNFRFIYENKILIIVVFTYPVSVMQHQLLDFFFFFKEKHLHVSPVEHNPAPGV